MALLWRLLLPLTVLLGTVLIQGTPVAVAVPGIDVAVIVEKKLNYTATATDTIRDFIIQIVDDLKALTAETEKDKVRVSVITYDAEVAVSFDFGHSLANIDELKSATNAVDLTVTAPGANLTEALKRVYELEILEADRNIVIITITGGKNDGPLQTLNDAISDIYTLYPTTAVIDSEPEVDASNIAAIVQGDMANVKTADWNTESINKKREVSDDLSSWMYNVLSNSEKKKCYVSDVISSCNTQCGIGMRTVTITCTKGNQSFSFRKDQMCCANPCPPSPGHGGSRRCGDYPPANGED